MSLFEVIPVTPRGYCQGVVRAIEIAKNTAKTYPDKTITMLGMIVHNKHVVDECNKMGINIIEDRNKTRLELLDSVKDGVVIFTAHGVSDEVYKKAESKGLIIVDATCKDVEKTHDLVRNHVNNGDVIYIGKHNHPEAEGVIGISDRVYLVSNKEEVDLLPSLTNILITNQTTLSIYETKKLIDYCLEKFNDAFVSPEICNATTIRQKAITELKDIDTLIVVGDIYSNNTNQLLEMGKETGIKNTYLIESVDMLTKDMLKDTKKIAVTSGSSTPTAITNQVIDFLKEYSETQVWKLPSIKDISIL